MEENTSTIPANGVVNAKCCENRVSTCMSDGNYFSSAQKVKDLPAVTAPVFGTPAKICIPAAYTARTPHSMVGPPVLSPFNSVDQSFICVFII